MKIGLFCKAREKNMFFIRFFGLLICTVIFAKGIEFKTGDIVFRQENTWLSTMFASLEDSPYAHVGILLKRGAEVYVVHLEIADGENGLRVQKWNNFLKNAKKWKLIRLKVPASRDRFESALQKYIRIKPTFNLSFSKGTESNMYCTQFVQAIYMEALGVNIAATRSIYQGKEFISTKDIYSNPLFIEVKN